MRLSQRARYAICGVFDLAYNGEGDPIQVRVIGARQRIPERYLEQIFRQLREAGLVHAKRGPGGGYVLARAPGAIDLRQVVEAVEGPLAERLVPEGEAGEELGPAFLWGELGERVAVALQQVDVETLCRRAARAAVPRVTAERLTYQI